MQAINWWDWEVTAFNAWAVAHVAIRENTARRPSRFVRVDLVESAAHVDTPFDVVKNEELGLWTEECGIAKAGRVQILLSALSDGAWIALIALHG